MNRVGGVERPLTFSLIVGGKSNLTYRITGADGRRWILRRPPLYGVIPSAHDMGREHRILAGLADSTVPVPRTIGFQSDPSLIGAPFYVMAFVDGLVLRDPQGASPALAPPARLAVGKSMVRTLLALHAIDPESVGLGNLSRSDGYLSRQLRAWGRQLGDVGGSSISQIQLLIEVRDRLSRSIPDQQYASIVHGDFRLDNVIVSEVGEVKAVLDWELCTLGDPIADVATLSVYWSEPDDSFFPLETATIVPGFAKRRDLVESYINRSELDFSRFAYYLAFASWRLAVILQGVINRYEVGAYGEAASGEWERLRDVVPRLGESALDYLRDDSLSSPL